METPSLHYLKELSCGNKLFEKKILKLLIEELPMEYNTYQQAIDSNNYFWASETVHRIKHKIAFFQMQNALNVTEKHEFALRSGKLNFQEEFQDIVTKILKFLPERPE